MPDVKSPVLPSNFTLVSVAAEHVLGPQTGVCSGPAVLEQKREKIRASTATPPAPRRHTCTAQAVYHLHHAYTTARRDCLPSPALGDRGSSFPIQTFFRISLSDVISRNSLASNAQTSESHLAIVCAVPSAIGFRRFWSAIAPGVGVEIAVYSRALDPSSGPAPAASRGLCRPSLGACAS